MSEVNHNNKYKQDLSSARQSVEARPPFGHENNADNNDANIHDYRNKLNQIRAMDNMEGGLNELKKLNYKKDGEIGSVIGDTDRLQKIGTNIASGKNREALMEAAKLGLDLRKQIKEGKNIPFVILIILSVAGDLVDLLNIVFDLLGWGIIIPPLGIITRIAIFIIMFFSLWGKGAFVKKIIVRILMVTVIESIPFFPFSLIAILPIETIAIIWIWSSMHKKIKKAEKKLVIVENVISKKGNRRKK